MQEHPQEDYLFTNQVDQHMWKAAYEGDHIRQVLSIHIRLFNRDSVYQLVGNATYIGSHARQDVQR